MAARGKSTRPDHLESAASTSPWMIDEISRCEWFTKRDRDAMLDLLYSNDVIQQKKGLARLAAWRARSHPRVPLGFEVTASLLVALMKVEGKDRNFNYNTESVAENEAIRLNLAMAIVRFVNLVTETGQVMHFSIEVSSIAKKMGVPEWIVDIRHSCSHTMLPSTRVLVSAAKFALEWTKKHFWEADDPLDVRGTFVIVDKHGSLSKNIQMADVVRRIVEAQLKCFDDKCLGNVTLAGSDMDYLSSIETDELVQILVEDGLLAASHDKRFGEFVDSKENAVLIVKRLQDFWIPTFEELLQRPGLFPPLAKALVLAATQSSVRTRRSQLALEWLALIVDRFVVCSSSSQAMREALLLIAPSINRNALDLLNRLKNTKSKRSFSLAENNSQQDVDYPIEIVTDCGAWKFCPGHEWSKCAIGDDRAGEWSTDKLQLRLNTDV